VRQGHAIRFPERTENLCNRADRIFCCAVNFYAMKKTGFLYDKRFLMHKTGSFHPEVPERLTAIFRGIKDAGLISKMTSIKAEPAEMKWI